jgi:site-specific DNA-methyltransferase (adenine-specific)
MLELNRIHCGDNCDLLGKMPRESVDLVVTSPPYDDLRTYGGHSWDFFGVAWHLKRVLKPGGVIVWVVADATKDGSETGSSFEQALHFKRLGLNLLDTMIWNKPPAGANGNNDAYSQSAEYMFIATKGKPKTSNRLADRRNVGAGTTMQAASGGRTQKYGATSNERKDVPELSDILDVSVKTLKNWEQKNLIPKARRSVFGWRIYSQAELDKTEGLVRKNNFFNKHQNAK